MDALSTIESCWKYGQLIKEYIEKTKEAHKERANYLSTILTVLHSLRGLKRRLSIGLGQSIPEPLRILVKPVSKPLPGGHVVFDGSREADGVLLALNESLAKLAKKLKERKGFKKAFDRLSWYFDDAEVKEQIDAVVLQRRVIEDLLQELDREEAAEDRVVFKDTNRRLKDVESTQRQEIREKEKRDIVHWLSPLNSLQQQDAFYKDKYASEKWLLETSEFKAWISGHIQACLWLYGDPGAGKTVLSARITQHIKDEYTNRNSIVLDLYIDYKDSESQSLGNLIGSLVKQVVQHRQFDVRSQKLKDLYHRSQDGEIAPAPADLMDVLQEEFRQYARVYLIIDGWNDVSDDARAKFNDYVTFLSTLDNVNTMISSRSSESETATRLASCTKCGTSEMTPHVYCEQCANSEFCLDCSAKGFSCGRTGHQMIQTDRLSVLVKATDGDIREYVKWEMSRELGHSKKRHINPRLGSTSFSTTILDRRLVQKPSLIEEIPKKIALKSRGNYQLAMLYVDSIKRMPTVKDVEDALQTLPEDLPGIYQSMMERFDDLKPRKRAKAVKFVLRWIACCARPLSFPEMQQAYAIEVGSHEYDPEDYLLDEDDIIQDTNGLVNIAFDQSSVRVHLTMHEYLHDNQPKYSSKKDEIDTALRILTCLNYDIFESPCIDDESAEIDTRLKELPLMAYASQYWPEHVASVCEVPEVKEFLLRFLSHQGKIASCLQVAHRQGFRNSIDFDVRKGVNGLHLAARYGLSSVIPDLVSTLGVDSTDPVYGQTALMYACRSGNLDVVDLLLAQKACVNLKSKRGNAAIFDAYVGWFGSNDKFSQATKRLLQVPRIDVNLRCEQKSKQTLLMLASHHGDIDTVRQLLSLDDIQINLTDQDGNTALLLAVQTGNLDVVQLLLAHKEIAINLSNENRETALTIAAKRSDPHMVDLLLSNGADPTARDPFLRAVDTGEVSIVKVFLQHQVSVHVLDSSSRTLLHSASLNGHDAIVNLLLDWDISVNAQGSRGETALHEACRGGRRRTSTLLIAAGADKTITDKSGRTPLMVARENAWKTAHYRIMNLLDPPAKEQAITHAEQLPMWSLVHIGLFEQVKQRQEGGTAKMLDQDPDTGNTALHYGVLDPRQKILEFLLGAGVSQSCTNHEGRTPLHLAVVHGNLLLTEVLLTYPNPPLLAKDSLGCDVLELAHRSEFEWRHLIAVALIKAGAEVDPDDRTNIQRTFMEAVKQGETKVASYLIGKGADILYPGDDGLTAKQIALTRSDVDMLGILRKHKSFFIPITCDGPDSGDEGDPVSPAASENGPLSIGPDLSKPAFRPRKIDVVV